MTSLVLHAPSGKARQEGKKSFDDTVRDGIGDRYAIGSKSYQQTRPGCRVVILDKDKRRRAEGTRCTNCTCGDPHRRSPCR